MGVPIIFARRRSGLAREAEDEAEEVRDVAQRGELEVARVGEATELVSLLPVVLVALLPVALGAASQGFFSPTASSSAELE
eukprot:1403566-Pleurochrysis_carterae.AAC.1